MLGEVGEQRDEAKCIVHVPEGVDEAGIALTNYIGQRVPRHLLFQFLRPLVFFATLHLLPFLKVRFNFMEFSEQRVVLEDL